MSKITNFLVQVTVGSAMYAFWSIVMFVLFLVHTVTVKVKALLGKGHLSIKNEYVIVTGGSGGFGVTFTDLLLKNGAKVISIDVVDPESKRKGVIYAKVDITSQVEIDAFINDVIKPLDAPIFALVNNAGIVGAPSGAIEISNNNLNHAMGVNFTGPVMLIRDLYPFMIQAKKTSVVATGQQDPPHPTRARIINVTSCAGLVTAQGLSAYNSSKFALEAFTDCLRIEMHKELDVTLLEPHYADTGIYKMLLNTPDEELEKGVLAEHYLRAKKKFGNALDAQQKDGNLTTNRTMMTSEFVGEVFLEAITARAPQDRYLVCPDLVTTALMRTFAHVPNYFLWADTLKRFGDKNPNL